MATAGRKRFWTLSLLIAGAVLLTLLLPPYITRHRAESWRPTVELLGSTAEDHAAYVDENFKVGDSRDSVEQKLIGKGRATAVTPFPDAEGFYIAEYILPWKPGSEIRVEGAFDKQNKLTGKMKLTLLLTAE